MTMNYLWYWLQNAMMDIFDDPNFKKFIEKKIIPRGIQLHCVAQRRGGIPEGFGRDSDGALHSFRSHSGNEPPRKPWVRAASDASRLGDSLIQLGQVEALWPVRAECCETSWELQRIWNCKYILICKKWHAWCSLGLCTSTIVCVWVQ